MFLITQCVFILLHFTLHKAMISVAGICLNYDTKELEFNKFSSFMPSNPDAIKLLPLNCYNKIKTHNIWFIYLPIFIKILLAFLIFIYFKTANWDFLSTDTLGLNIALHYLYMKPVTLPIFSPELYLYKKIYCNLSDFSSLMPPLTPTNVPSWGMVS